VYLQDFIQNIKLGRAKHAALECRGRGILISTELWERIIITMLCSKKENVFQGACSPREIFEKLGVNILNFCE